MFCLIFSTQDQIGETNRQKRSKEKLDSDITELKSKIDEKDTEITALHGVIDTHVKQIGRLELDIKESKTANDKVSKELEQTLLKQEKLQADYNNATYEVNKTKKILQERIQEHKVNITFFIF